MGIKKIIVKMLFSGCTAIQVNCPIGTIATMTGISTITSSVDSTQELMVLGDEITMWMEHMGNGGMG